MATKQTKKRGATKPRTKRARLELVKDDAGQVERTAPNGRAPEQTATDTAPLNPTVTMTWEGEPEPCWTGPLDEIAQANADNGLDQGEEWIAEVRAALTEHGEYTGGGGAAPEYVLRVVEQPAAKAKRKRTKRSPAAQEGDGGEPAAAPAPAADSADLAPEPATEPTAEEPPAQAPKRGRGRRKPSAMTLATLAEKFLAALEADGRSDATIGAYRSDLAIAQRVLGEETAIDSVRPADVQRFNASDDVILSRTGQPKARPTIDRTRRVLRLAFEFAEAEGFVVTTPCIEPGAEIEA